MSKKRVEIKSIETKGLSFQTTVYFPWLGREYVFNQMWARTKYRLDPVKRPFEAITELKLRADFLESHFTDQVFQEVLQDSLKGKTLEFRSRYRMEGRVFPGGLEIPNAVVAMLKVRVTDLAVAFLRSPKVAPLVKEALEKKAELLKAQTRRRRLRGELSPLEREVVESLKRKGWTMSKGGVPAALSSDEEWQ